MRIALYGGTFDPVHEGHTNVADGLLKLFALDRVLFIPAYVAPHKRGASVTPALHRHAMLALATQGDARLLVSTVELDAPERPYTVGTLSRMRERLGADVQLFFVMGADSWMEITTWREWERVLNLANHIVVTRPGYEVSAHHVTPAIREMVIDLRGLKTEEVEREIEGSTGSKIYITDAVNLEASSTEIRRAVREGLDDEWTKSVAPPVADYIRKYGLYR